MRKNKLEANQTMFHKENTGYHMCHRQGTDLLNHIGERIGVSGSKAAAPPRPLLTQANILMILDKELNFPKTRASEKF